MALIRVVLGCLWVSLLALSNCGQTDSRGPGGPDHTRLQRGRKAYE